MRATPALCSSRDRATFITAEIRVQRDQRTPAYDALTVHCPPPVHLLAFTDGLVERRGGRGRMERLVLP
jgi:hypothetical protein